MIPNLNDMNRDFRDRLVVNCIIDILRYMSNGVSGEVAVPLLIMKYGTEICYCAIFRIEELFV